MLAPSANRGFSLSPWISPLIITPYSRKLVVGTFFITIKRYRFTASHKGMKPASVLGI